ncbi:hypothetical protein [Paenibacillus gallinarum]|uniref:Uncharacterized protein n=1 Tax=Paenibacillus gallinarum TaxID=2762232 RepID=A0ABR8T3C8_9BACL|nr:hypothetical protein [Paenibacillus gallinarum]MBD7970284.1 hypothetical protein [Paenibacillus gallinarum]
MSEKPKRISFWESENEVIRQWCKDQTNLGTSLDLIIADAIKVYGKGDVIKAYLNQRMMDMQSQGSANYVPSQQEPPVTGLPNRDQVSSFRENETYQNEFADASEGAGFVDPQRGGNSEHGDISNISTDDNLSGTQVQESDSEDDYNPIDILLRDAGSGLRP